MKKQHYLLISEKPSLMRAVRDAFGKSAASKRMDVDFIALHGHCCTLAQPQDYDPKYAQWNREDLPILPKQFKHVPLEKDLVATIRKMIKENHYDGLINCTDPEREGQNIFYSLMDVLKCRLPVLRYWVIDQTEEKLIQSWDSMKDDRNDPYLSRLTWAALLRAEADWKVGMNASRALGQATGRVMSPLLCILAKRETEIRDFKPQTGYDVYADYVAGFDGRYVPENPENKKGPAFAKEKDARAFMDSLGDTGTVTQASRKQSKQNAPLLYSLGALQNDANRLYGFTLAESLALIQQLYEKKVLTYPRTDCSYITTAMAEHDLDKIIACCQLVPECAGVKPDTKLRKSYAASRYVNDSKVQAHAAITFTGQPFAWDMLNPDERKICSLVAKRILATLLPPAEYSEAVIEVSVPRKDDDAALFRSTQKVLIKPGYLALYDKESQEEALPKLKKGSRLAVQQFRLKPVTTTCPPRYNDESLNNAMINVGSTLNDKEMEKILRGTGSKEQGGIGTPATRSGIVEKLLQPRKHNGKSEPWVVREKKSFRVTPSGMAAAETLSGYDVSSAILTAQWEKKLKGVEDGTFKPEQFTREIDASIREQTAKMIADHPQRSSGHRQLPRIWLSHIFTEQELQALSSGDSVRCDDLVSKKTGNTFCAEVKVKNGRIQIDHFVN